MSKLHITLTLTLIIILAGIFVSCTKEQDEQIRENVRVPGLQEGVQARDRSLETAVQSNIESDIELRWFAQTYGITISVSHTVATVYMKVKTEDLHERAIGLAKGTDGVTEVIDNIEVDSSLDSAPFEW